VAAALLSFGAVRDPHLAGWLISLVVAIMVLVVPSAIGRLNARVRITQETVEYRGFFRVPRRIDRSDLDRVVRLRFLVLGSRFVFTRLLFLDRVGRARLSMQAEWFAPADLDRMQSELAVPWSDSGDDIAPRAANRLYPGAASWALIHRYELAGVGAVVALLVIGLLSGGRRSWRRASRWNTKVLRGHRWHYGDRVAAETVYDYRLRHRQHPFALRTSLLGMGCVIIPRRWRPDELSAVDRIVRAYTIGCQWECGIDKTESFTASHRKCA
jgi:hypothetical protein